MDHYDVLGVRPTAGAVEIELAFKGRRSQYHPDRYSGQDAETLAWATERMKQVNAAYEVLSDPPRRQRYDEERHAQASSTKPRGADRPSYEPSSNGGMAKVVRWRDILADSGVPLMSMDKSFCAPHIPVRKLAGALGAYGQGLAASEVIFLFDDTLLGGAERGLVITDGEIRVNDRLGSCRVGYGEIDEIESQGQAVVVNRTLRIASFTRQSSCELRSILALLNDYLNLARYQAPSAGEPDVGARAGARLMSICHQHMGPGTYSGSMNCSIGQAIPRDHLRVLRFTLGLPVEEEIFAISNLAVHGNAEGFAVTSRGLHARVGSQRAFVPWRKLRHLSVVGAFQESIRCGVTFGDGTRIFCSRARSDNAIFGPSLMSDLAASLEL